MKLLIIISTLALAGCWNTVPPRPPETVVKYKYVVTTVSEEFLEIPPKVPDLNVETATDKDVANWILDKEQRTENLEIKLGKIKSNQQQKIDNLKKDSKIAPEDIIIK